MQQGRDSRGQRGEQPQAGGQAVHSIDQVERVGTAYQPQQGQRQTPPAIRRDLSATPIRAQRRSHLSEEFLPGFERDQIVDQAGGED